MSSVALMQWVSEKLKQFLCMGNTWEQNEAVNLDRAEKNKAQWQSTSQQV